MSYSAVPTVATGDLWGAANHNTFIRDNFAAGVPDIFTAAGDLAYATAANAAAPLAIGSPGQVLTSSSDGLPEWQNSSSIIYHQGGSETQLNVPGTTDYPKSGLAMIMGVALFPVGDSGITVTYPFEWADKPLIMVGVPYQYGAGGYSGTPLVRLGGDTAGQSTTDFDIDIVVNDRTAIFAVPWIAIGDPA